MSKFYDIAKVFVADNGYRKFAKPIVHEGYPYASDGKIAYWGHVVCPEQESEDTHLAVEIKKLINEAHEGKLFSFEFDEVFVENAKYDYKIKLEAFLDEKKEEKEKYDRDTLVCPHCGEKVYYAGYDLIEYEEMEDAKESDFLYAVEIEGRPYNWRYIQMMMNAIPKGEWYVVRREDRFGHDYYGLMRHSEEATAYMLALFPDTETRLEATIKKGENDER